eukprot:TRINITY_DN9664_c0_g1_i1.p1 TRINITY_DN9664_c0_g1~~TRINITY_DN9664_c0_g1_i1.p1  ORF type:complete len:195 (+),score=45.72 TRINITY_DN9664_c0_g1_i1:63-647(+)
MGAVCGGNAHDDAALLSLPDPSAPPEPSAPPSPEQTFQQTIAALAAIDRSLLACSRQKYELEDRLCHEGHRKDPKVTPPILSAEVILRVYVPEDSTHGCCSMRYEVDGVGWRPLYDIRVLNRRSDAAQITYFAAVTQQTGEDWADVQLSFGSGASGGSSAVPPLRSAALALTTPAPTPPSSSPSSPHRATATAE